MSLLTELWIGANRLRRRIGKPPLERMHADREAWVREHAPGKSFVDVGGMLGRNGSFCFLAEESGATEVSLFDGGDPTPEFHAEHERRGSRVRYMQGDLEDQVVLERLGRHDIVYSTGVIYHSPNPVLQLMNLREICGSLLYLGSATIPEVPGVEQACMYYPYLGDGARTALKRPHWKPEHGWGIGTPFVEKPMWGHANFWWGITPSALLAMLRSARFEVLEVRKPHAHPWWTDVIARPEDRQPPLPPVDYYRLRGEARERGEPELPFDTYYDEAQ